MKENKKKEALVKVEIRHEAGEYVHIQLGGKILVVKKEELLKVNVLQ